MMISLRQNQASLASASLLFVFSIAPNSTQMTYVKSEQSVGKDIANHLHSFCGK